MRDLANELKEYADIEAYMTPQNFYWHDLVLISNSTEYMSEEFEAALEKEIRHQLLDIQTSYEVREITETIKKTVLVPKDYEY